VGGGGVGGCSYQAPLPGPCNGSGTPKCGLVLLKHSIHDRDARLLLLSPGPRVHAPRPRVPALDSVGGTPAVFPVKRHPRGRGRSKSRPSLHLRQSVAELLAKRTFTEAKYAPTGPRCCLAARAPTLLRPAPPMPLLRHALPLTSTRFCSVR